MRTAIYVAEPSTITIRATDPRDSRPQLYRFPGGDGVPALGIHELAPGIYQVLSNELVDVTGGGDLTVVSLSKGKDIPPEPKARVLEVTGATTAAINAFFGVAKDADPPPSPPSPPVDDEAGGPGGAGDVEDE